MGDVNMTTNVQTTGRTQSRFKAGLLAGIATSALLAGAVTLNSLGSFAADTAPGAKAGTSATLPARTIAGPDFSDLAAAVKPTVVSVRVKARADKPNVEMSENGNPFEGTPFEKFFKGMPGQEGPMAPEGRRNRSEPLVQGQGSGFFVSADGYIVTNNHVVANAVKVEVITDDGSTLDAKVIGTDKKTDLALLKVDGRNDFPFAKLAQDMPKIGEWVVAMGNPFGLGGTVTAGIVSAQGRDIGSGPYDDYIQIDAPVNRGNSGGPTFNMKGEVIGVNTAIYSPSGGSVGIAFAIPASTVSAIVPQLKADGHVSRGWLGVQIQPVTKEIADSLGMKTASGALISGPQAGSPAAEAGLKAGDVITSVDSHEVKDPRALASRIATLGPNKQVALRIIRDGKEQTVKLRLGALKDEQATKVSSNTHRGGSQLGDLGLTVVPASQLKGAGEQGLAITKVDPNGKAAELGLTAGDVIVRAGSKAVASADDLTAALKEAKAAGRKNALVMVKRDKTERFVALPVAVG